MPQRSLPAFLFVLLLAALPRPLEAAPVKLDFLGEKTPGDGLVLLSRDGQRYLTFELERKLGCDPQDLYGAGDCDWRVRAQLHSVTTGQQVGRFTFVWGRWKQKTDRRALAQRLAVFAEPQRAVQQSEARRYAIGRYHVVIDGKGRAVRLRVLAQTGGKVVFQQHLQGNCKARGKHTIWGAEIFAYPAHKLLFVQDPRACKKRMVVVVRLP